MQVLHSWTVTVIVWSVAVAQEVWEKLVSCGAWQMGALEEPTTVTVAVSDGGGVPMMQG